MREHTNYIKYLAALLLFGSNGIVASKIALSSYEIVFLRALVGGVFLLAAFKLTRGTFRGYKNKTRFACLMLSGAAMGASWMLLYEGYNQIGVSLSTLAYYIGPVLVMALSPFLFGEKLTAAKTIGILAALSGMVLVDFDLLMKSGVSWGLACGLLAAVMYAVMVALNKKATGVDGLENAIYQLSAGFFTVAAFTFVKQGLFIPVKAESAIPILILGVVNTGVGCYLYFSSIGGLRAQTVAICGYLEPLSALLFSAAFLGEQLTAAQAAGAALIFGGAAAGECWDKIKPVLFRSRA